MGKESLIQTRVKSDRLTFNIIRPQNVKVSQIITYGYYYGYLLETFLNHFDKMFKEGWVSAPGEPGDIVRSD